MECDGCTMCCLLLPVPWLNKPAGQLCRYCEAGVGCQIFNTALTEECKKFRCAYNQIENAPISLRPDKCKIIFEKVNNEMFLGTMHPDYKNAYKTEVIQKQLMIFYAKGFSVILAILDNESPLVIYPAKDRKTSEVYEEFQKKLRTRNDCTSILN